MMMRDFRCSVCGHYEEDFLLRDGVGVPSHCNQLMDKVQTPPHVHGDDIPGGYWVKHGICNPDGTPKRYDTKSSMLKAAEAKGMHQHVEHVTKGTGSDKNPHTQRFV